MRLADIGFGEPFILRENPDVKPRLFYRMWIRVVSYSFISPMYSYSCFEVVNGCISDVVLLSEDTIVERYVFREKSV